MIEYTAWPNSSVKKKKKKNAVIQRDTTQFNADVITAKPATFTVKASCLSFRLSKLPVSVLIVQVG